MLTFELIVGSVKLLKRAELIINLTLILRTPSASSPWNLMSSGERKWSSLPSSSSAFPVTESSSSSSLSISSLLFLPLLPFRFSCSPSRKLRNPTVPPGLRGPRLEKSGCSDLLFVVEPGASCALGSFKIPIFCSCPKKIRQFLINFHRQGGLNG